MAGLHSPGVHSPVFGTLCYSHLVGVQDLQEKFLGYLVIPLMSSAKADLDNADRSQG